MNIILKKLTLAIMIFIFFLVSTFLIAKNLYYYRIPKSAKLVFYLENNHTIMGEK